MGELSFILLWRFFNKQQENHGDFENIPYHRLRPPSAQSRSTESIYMSLETPGALLFATISREMG
jgi:hypothetical protein